MAVGTRTGGREWCSLGRQRFHRAAEKGFSAALHLIEKGADVNERNEEGKPPLLIGGGIGPHQIMRLLLDHDAEVDRTGRKGTRRCIAPSRTISPTRPRCWSAGGGREFSREAWRHGAPDQRRGPGKRRLSCCWRGQYRAPRQPRAHRALPGGGKRSRQRRSQAHLLGADVNHATRSGATPLMIAVKHHDPSLARWLIERGAEVEAADSRSKTALQVAVAAGATRAALYSFGRRPAPAHPGRPQPGDRRAA